MDAGAARHNESRGLARTFQLAWKDEALLPGRLPLLFRLDQELGVEDGRRYLSYCGSATAACPAPADATCLAHLPRPRDGGDGGAAPSGHGDGAGDSGGGDGGAGGCGGGCGGS